MSKNRALIILPFLPLLLLMWFISTQGAPATKNHISVSPTPSQDPNCVPTFVDGDGPYYKTNAPFRTKIVPDQHNGTKLIVSGRVMANDCKTTLSGVTLDIWQADETGSYQNEWYRGQVTSAEDGTYHFETVAPKGYGQGTAYRPPHIHFKARKNNTLIITSEMFLPEARAQQIEDAFILKIIESEENGKKTLEGIHDIILPISPSKIP
jgi:protocatechuate 3,4-dioxygenase beta subunit